MQSHSDRTRVPAERGGGPLHALHPRLYRFLANTRYSKACIAYKSPRSSFDQWMRQRRIKWKASRETYPGIHSHRQAIQQGARRCSDVRSLLKSLQEANVVSYLQPKDERARRAAAQVSQYLTEQRGFDRNPCGSISSIRGGFLLSALQMAHSL